ncbi:hypothetical protein [Clostridium sp. JN-1]|uniref:hypothetical protein n=1 Tax=Clostridium sp. JN-1 TaxID=2483110 RepID=UPI000F0B6240|nr:hypothetical protein [Clostridium sp. JN-1]
MEFDELKLEYQKLKNGFKLFENIIEYEDDMDLNVDLIKIEKIINERLPDIFKENAPSNVHDLYFGFKYELSKFKDFIMYDKLMDKKIVAIGGSYSSKKSSFLNFLLENQVFSLKSNPENLISTYIVNGQDTEICGLNASYSKIQVKLSNLKSFSKLFDEDEENILNRLGLQDIFKSVLISTPIQVYKNISFLNIPLNYNTYYSDRFYEKTAVVQLNSSNYVIWFMQSSSIDSIDEEISFISKLRKETPKLIIVNNDDDCTKEEINKIINKLKDIFDSNGIDYLNVLSYSSKISDEFDNNRIREYLENWNDEMYESKFVYNFKLLFVKCMEYYKYVIENESKRLNILTNSLDLSDNVSVKESLFLLSEETEKNINNLKRTILSLRKVEDEFFMRIKGAANNFGIIIQEISETDLEDQVIDPLKVVKEYMKNHLAKSDPAINIMIYNTLKDVNPIMNKELGGFAYKAELSSMIRKILVLKKDEIKFNEPGDNVNKFIECINKL